MASIDQEGIAELNEKIKNPLESIYNKLETKGIFAEVADEFDFIYRFLENIEQNWDRPGGLRQSAPKVVVDGKEYQPTKGA